MNETILEYSFSDVLKFVGKLVEIQHLHKLPSSVGIIALVDPQSLTLLVATSSGTRIVIPSSILAIDEVKNPKNFDRCNLIEKNFHGLQEEIRKRETKNSDHSKGFLNADLENRKKLLLLSLGKQHLPFVVQTNSDVIKVLNCVEVHSPFTPETCFSANEIILSKVKKLVSQL